MLAVEKRQNVMSFLESTGSLEAQRGMAWGGMSQCIA
jgi:hypothetical protein